MAGAATMPLAATIVAVTVVALAVLFLLTALALGASGRLRHPLRVGAGLTGAFVLGVALLID